MEDPGALSLRPLAGSKCDVLCEVYLSNRAIVMKMFTMLILTVAFAPFANAQGNDSPTRAGVQAETRTLLKAGKLAPAGEGVRRDPETNYKSAKTRAERKSETRLAAERHELLPPGAIGSFKADAALRAQPTTRSRSERKAETRLAEKNGTLAPAGERPDPPRR